MGGGATARFTFHEDVRQFLEPGNRGRGKWPRALVRRARETGVVDYPALRAASLKDAIEALGVPHTEVGRLTVDGRETDFGHRLAPGQEIGVFAVRGPVDVTRTHALRPAALARVAFVVDANVGGLAPLLRTLGLDTAYGRDWGDARIARVAREEGRIVLTRDRGLLKRSEVVHGRLVRARDPLEQLTEVLALYGLRGPFRAFGRCLRCNAVLRPVSKAEVLDRLEPLTKKHYDEFSQCPGCGRVYWRGSHHAAMARRLRAAGVALLDEAGGDEGPGTQGNAKNG
jgi:hypothetical protein